MKGKARLESGKIIEFNDDDCDKLRNIEDITDLELIKYVIMEEMKQRLGKD